MKSMSPTVGVLFLAVTSLNLRAQDSLEHPISLVEAVRMAQRNSPITTQARGTSRIGRATVTTALAQFLPSVGLSAGASHSAGATYFQGKLVPFSGDPWSYSKGYGANLTIFDGGQRWFNYRASQASLRASSDNEVLQRFNVALSVKQQYYAVLAARETEAAAQRQLEAADQQMRVTLAQLGAGAASRLDSLRSAVTIGAARLAIINAQNSIRSANATLTRLVASPVPVTAFAADTSEVPAITADSAELEKLASDGPAVRQARASLAANSATRKANMTSYLPTLSMNYRSSNSKTAQDFVWGGAFPSSSKGYGFSLNYTVFNNFFREANYVQASVNEDIAEANFRDARLAAKENLANYLGIFRAAMETIELQRLTIAAAEEELRGQLDRYRLGVGTTLLLVSNAQAALDQARLALINARFQARTAKAQIEALVGKELN
jgi:outer membrane protein